MEEEFANKKKVTSLSRDLMLSALAFSPTDKLMMDKFTALIQLASQANHYIKEGFMEQRLVRPMAEKKIEFIMSATSKKQLKEILEPPKVGFNGNKVVPIGNYSVPEEELMIWSKTSLEAPLNREGFERYCELFVQLFPEHSDVLDTQS